MASTWPSRGTLAVLAIKNAKILQGNMAAASEIKDATTARQFLEAQGYCGKDQHIHVPLLATITLQLSLKKLDAQGAANVFRALSFLMEIQLESDLTKRITESVLQRIDEGIKQIPAIEALKAAATECGDAACKVKVALEEFKDDCQDLSWKLSKAANKVALAIPAAIEEVNSTKHNSRPIGLPQTYANVVTQPWTSPMRNMTTPQTRN